MNWRAALARICRMRECSELVCARWCRAIALRKGGPPDIITAGANAMGQSQIIGAHGQAVPGQVLGDTLPGLEIYIFELER